MNKYLRAAICEGVTLLKFFYLKILHRNNFEFSLINICSPLSEVEISKYGVLHIGKGFKMRSNSHLRVRRNGRLTLGDDVSLNYGNMIVCYENIKIGNNVQFGPNVLIYDQDHDFRVKDGLKNLLYKTSPIEIGNNVWIGANTVILRGSKIGNDCVIGAGSIVKGQIPYNTVFVQKREMKQMSIVREYL